MNEMTIVTKGEEATKIKAALLANGVSLSKEAIDNYSAEFLEKRRAYGNPDPLSLLDQRIPQELFVIPGEIVCSVNVRNDSIWRLRWNEGVFYVDNGENKYVVTFPRRPEFYEKMIDGDERVNNMITLYGGSTLGVFVNRYCSYIAIGKACKFCSLEQNIEFSKDFAKVVKIEEFKKALRIALADDSIPIKQVMINGGNFAKEDESFRYYIRVVEAARSVISDLKKDVDIHLIAFPPRDYSLFEGLKGLGVSLAMNTEVYDSALFDYYCPGKSDTYSQGKLFNAMEKAVNTLGTGSVFSIFVGGLEGIASLTAGMKHHASLGVIPVINVLHVDPNTPIGNRAGPSEDDIYQMGFALQNIYNEYRYPSFYTRCGRNAIDYEARMNYFSY